MRINCNFYYEIVRNRWFKKCFLFYREEEAQCPICLTNMVEGEILVVCETGCLNLLHHHCMAVWAAHIHSQKMALLCPLCRAPWPAKSSPPLVRKDVSARNSPENFEEDALDGNPSDPTSNHNNVRNNYIDPNINHNYMNIDGDPPLNHNIRNGNDDDPLDHNYRNVNNDSPLNHNNVNVNNDHNNRNVNSDHNNRNVNNDSPLNHNPRNVNNDSPLNHNPRNVDSHTTPNGHDLISSRTIGDPHVVSSNASHSVPTSVETNSSRPELNMVESGYGSVMAGLNNINSFNYAHPSSNFVLTSGGGNGDGSNRANRSNNSSTSSTGSQHFPVHTSSR